MKNFPMALAAGLVVLACSGHRGSDGSSPATTDVVLITLDTTRQDRLGCYGHREAHTPNVDRLAHEGVRFANAYTCAPLTFPSHATMLTGVYPFVHQGHDNALFALPTELPTLATLLEQHGYRTGAFVSAVVLDGKFGLGRGFEAYDDHFAMNVSRIGGMAERSGDRTTDAALAWLQTLGKDDRVFLWLHLFDAHRPWEEHPELKDVVADPYDAEIAFADAQVGRLLDQLANLGRSGAMVVVVADHGEGMGEHGETTHGMLIHDATMRVPLIVKHPSLRAGSVVDGFARTVDLTPTILDGLGLPVPASMQGVSLWARMRGGAEESPPAYLETYHPHYQMGWSYLEGLVKGKLKYVDAPEEELYDLDADPGENVSVAAQKQAAVNALRAELAALHQEAPQVAAAPANIPAQMLTQITNLGYTGTLRPINPKDRGLNPREHLDALDKRESARELGYNANVLMRTGKPAEAIELFTRAIGLYEEYEKLCREKAQALEMLGSTYAQRAETHRMLGALAEQAHETEKVAQHAADSKRDYEQGRDLLERAIKDNAMLLDGRLNLANCCFYLGNVDGFESHLLEAVKTFPKDPRAHMFLGQLYGNRGQTLLVKQHVADPHEACDLLHKGKDHIELALQSSQGVAGQEQYLQQLLAAVNQLLGQYCK